MTFLLNLPWGGTTVASIPLAELPLVTVNEAQKLCAIREGETPAGRLHSFTDTQSSAVGLYLPGSFLFHLAAARAGFPTTAATSKLRLVLQQQELHTTTFIPVEKVVGLVVAVALAADRGCAAPLSIISETVGEAQYGAPLCSLWLLLRLPGGKGGFGALLKKQQRKRRANFSLDACRCVPR